MELSVIIPAYNEEARIPATLDAYAGPMGTRDAEVLVIVNGSDDHTETIIRDDYLSRYPMIRMVVIPEKVGKGGALMRGLAEARGDKVAFTDADGSTPPDALLELADALSGSGCRIGSRWLPQSVIGRPQPLSRRVASRIFNGMVRALFGLKVTDTQCGAKVMSRDVVDTVRPLLGCTQWAFDVELLFHVRRNGYPINEAPIEWTDAAGSKVAVFRSSFEMFLALLRLRMRHSPFRWIVDAWDSTLGRRLYDRRIRRMRAVYRGSSHA